MLRSPRLLSLALLVSALAATDAAAQRCTGEVCMWAEERRGEQALFVRNNRTDRIRVTVWFPVLRGMRADREVPRTVTLAPGAEVQALKLVPAAGQMGGFVYRFDWQPDPEAACASQRMCVRIERNAVALRFMADNRQDVPVTVYLTHGTRQDSVLVRPRSRAEIARLLPDTPLPAWRYRWAFGMPGAVPDTAFAYALPFATGTAARVRQGSDPGANPQSRHAVTFAVAEGAPVLAARDGYVIAVVDSLEGRRPDSLRAAPSTSGLPPGAVEVAPGVYERRTSVRVNFVLVLHDDGTAARYLGLARESAAVAVGTRIRQGQPVGQTTDETFGFIVLASPQRQTSLPVRFRVGGTVRRLVTGDAVTAEQ